MTVEIREQGSTDTEQLKAIIDKMEEMDLEYDETRIDFHKRIKAIIEKRILPLDDDVVIIKHREKVVKYVKPLMRTKEYMKNYVERKTGERTENYVAVDDQKVVGFLGYWEPTSSMMENTQLDMIFVDLNVKNREEIEHDLFKFYSEMEECYEP